MTNPKPSSKSQGQIWLFFNRETKKKRKPLNYSEAQMFILGMKVNDLSNYAIWTPGWNQWQKLSRFLRSNQKYFVLAPHIPIPDSKPSQRGSQKVRTNTALDLTRPGYTDVSFDRPPPPKEWIPGTDQDYRAELMEMAAPPIPIRISQNFSEKRREERHNCKLEIVLMTATGSFFRTFSRNISLSGTLLGDPLPPAFLRQTFDLMVVNPLEKNPTRNKIVFQGRIIGDIMDGRRLTFVNPSDESMSRLQTLLYDYLAKQKFVAIA
ncbi:MAG: PilZ domain-containing protein [Bdellovibrionota bacterium]